MSKQYSPMHFLRKVSKELLKQYFTDRKLLLDIKFTDLKKGEIESIYNAWQALPEEKRNAIDQDFQEIHDLAINGGVNTILKEANYHGENLASEFAKLKDPHDHVFWTFLEHPQYWSNILMFNHADQMPAKQWNKYKNLPQNIQVKDECIRELENQLSTYFSTQQGRGKNCKVDHYKREDQDYFVAYPEDYMQSDVGWDNEILMRRSRRPAFEIIFVYSPREKTLNICALGGRDLVAKLYEIFCMAVLKIKANYSLKDERVYNLTPLLSQDFCFIYEAESGIVDVSVKKFSFNVHGNKKWHLTISTNPSEGKQAIFDLLNKITRTIPLHQMMLIKVGLKVTFLDTLQPNKRKTRSFEISHPNSCSLKYFDDGDQLIRTMLIKSGIESVSTVQKSIVHEQPSTTSIA